MTSSTTETVDMSSPATPAASPAVEISSLTKTFRRADGSQVLPIDDVTLTVDRGELLVLLGPSGCGKTTLLRCIAGLEVPDSGRISLFGEDVFGDGKAVPPERRGIGMVFQSYALWPHMTVFQNVAYPLRAARVAKAEIKERVAAVLETVGVPEIAGQVPGRLSGGQQQRVSLARALVTEPRLILFDEPLSNVDAKVREELRIEIAETQQRLGFTAIYVTHDQVEAMELATRMAVLDSGRIAQLDTPDEVYTRPTSRYVATFVGTANQLAGQVVGADGDTLVIRPDGAAGDVRVDREDHPVTGGVGDGVQLIWRPEATRVERTSSSSAGGSGLVVPTEVSIRRFLGAYTEVVCDVGTSGIRAAVPGRSGLATGDQVVLTVDPSDLRVYDAEGGDG